jgi:thiosulfate dehydrogenase [quinone] large subunit
VSALLNVGGLGGTRTSVPMDRSLRRLRGAAVVRILFGLLWAIDAWLKWLPGFIGGQTIAHELNPQSVSTPVVHGWVQLWHDVAGMNPGMFAMGTAVIETLLAAALIFGILSNLTFIVTAAFSFGIWTAPEHMHLPWGTPGMTDLGPSIGYVFAALALFYATAGATWSVDAVIRPHLGRFAPLAGTVPAA